VQTDDRMIPRLVHVMLEVNGTRGNTKIAIRGYGPHRFARILYVIIQVGDTLKVER